MAFDIVNDVAGCSFFSLGNPSIFPSSISIMIIIPTNYGPR
jgi:hypothetical protein